MEAKIQEQISLEIRTKQEHCTRVTRCGIRLRRPKCWTVNQACPRLISHEMVVRECRNRVLLLRLWKPRFQLLQLILPVSILTQTSCASIYIVRSSKLRSCATLVHPTCYLHRSSSFERSQPIKTTKTSNTFTTVRPFEVPLYLSIVCKISLPTYMPRSAPLEFLTSRALVMALGPKVMLQSWRWAKMWGSAFEVWWAKGRSTRCPLATVPRDWRPTSSLSPLQWMLELYAARLSTHQVGLSMLCWLHACQGLHSATLFFNHDSE